MSSPVDNALVLSAGASLMSEYLQNERQLLLLTDLAERSISVENFFSSSLLQESTTVGGTSAESSSQVRVMHVILLVPGVGQIASSKTT